MEQFTQGRSQPDWLVKYLHPGAGSLSVMVQMRPPTPDAVWFPAGEVKAEPLAVLNGERGAVAEIPLPACRWAPDLKVRLQFSVADAPAPVATVPAKPALPRAAKAVTPPVPEVNPLEVQAKADAEAEAIAGVAEAGGPGFAFASCGDGTLTVIKEEAGSFSVVEKIPTRKGARTMALDPVTHAVYLPTAEFEPAPTPTPGQGRGRPKMVPGSFMVLKYIR